MPTDLDVFDLRAIGRSIKLSVSRDPARAAAADRYERTRGVRMPEDPDRARAEDLVQELARHGLKVVRGA